MSPIRRSEQLLNRTKFIAGVKRSVIASVFRHHALWKPETDREERRDDQANSKLDADNGPDLLGGFRVARDNGFWVFREIADFDVIPGAVTEGAEFGDRAMKLSGTVSEHDSRHVKAFLAIDTVVGKAAVTIAYGDDFTMSGHGLLSKGIRYAAEMQIPIAERACGQHKQQRNSTPIQTVVGPGLDRKMDSHAVTIGS